MLVRHVAAVAILVLLVSSCGSTETDQTDALETTAPSVTADNAQPTTTAAVATTVLGATTTTTTPEPEATENSLQSPLPVGAVGQVGDWAIRVVSITPDATEIVMAENQFNDPPSEGHQFFMVSIEATYTGDASSTFWVDNYLNAVGASSVAYESFDSYCGSIPDSLSDKGETFPGGTITGNECWSIATADADSMVMFAEESFSFGDTRLFFSLDPTMTPIDASTASGGNGLDASTALPVGEVGQVGDWEVRVVSVNPDAAELVLAENQFNDPPADGEIFFLVAIEATYTGDESSTFWVDNDLKAVGASSVAYESIDSYCGSIPDALSDKGETFPGGTITGNECWRIAAADADSLVMIAEESFAFDEPRVLFSLTP